MKSIGKILLIITAIIILLVVIKSFQTPVKISTEPNKYSAIAIAEKFVKQSLKAPSTAEFSPMDETKINIFEDNDVWVDGYVDAQNSFGAMLRSRYSVKMKYNPNNRTFTLTSINIE